MDIENKLNIFLEENLEEIINIRGILHENPEISEHEYETSKFIKDKLKDIGAHFLEVEGNSIIGVIEFDKSGKTLLLRADIDALAIEENICNMKSNKKFVSKNPGISHMCGHDAHTTMLIATLKFLNTIKNTFKGRIIFVFEEAEENGQGIPKILNALKDEKIDACFGMHVVNFIESGKINIDFGPRLAAASGIDIDIIGHGGHGSRPDQAINPLFCASDIINSISNQWTNRFAPNEICTLGLTNLIGGEAKNIIEEKMKLVGTIRYFSKEIGEKGLSIITDTASNVGKTHGCDIIINHKMETSKPLINNENLFKFANEKLKNYFGDSLVEVGPWYASETFSLYSQLAPSLYAFLGNNNNIKGTTADVHDPRFDIDDENTLPTGIKAMSLFTYHFLNEF